MLIKFKVKLVYLGKQEFEFGDGKVLKLKEDPCSFSMVKVSFSSLKKIHVTNLKKQDLEGGGKILKLTDNQLTIHA
jgi:hypothetical protein